MLTEVSQVGPLEITEVYPLEDVSQVDTLVTLEFNPQRTYCCPYSIRCRRTPREVFRPTEDAATRLGVRLRSYSHPVERSYFTGMGVRGTMIIILLLALVMLGIAIYSLLKIQQLI